MNRDGLNRSLWQEENSYKVSNTVNKDKYYDVVIVGGGITGITTGLLLQAAGKQCLVAEAYTIGFGTTGGTTAHLNTFFDTPYSKVIKSFGEKNAALLAKGAKDAIALIKKNIADHAIDCDFSELDGFLFSINESQDKELTEIVEAAQQVNVAVTYTNNSPFPIPYLKLASFSNQAQFNPIKYIFSLAAVFEKLGGVIAEDHRVINIDPGDEELVIKTSQGELKAAKAIYATHIPPGINLLHFRCAPYRSYAIAVQLKSNNYPRAVGYDMNDPYHYYRSQKVDDQYYLIAGGEDHKTGHEENTDACFRRLESHVKGYFDVASVTHKWSSQYYEPADGLPYIGNLPGSDSNIYVATGYGGNGMIYGTLASIILSDILVKGESMYQDLFDPNRIKPIAGFGNFVKENADVVGHFIKDRFSSEKIVGLSELAAGEAKVVKYDGHTLAFYKDDFHTVHALNPVCTHAKCIVSWNASERSWDCPCHGARYSVDGEVLNGPADRALEKIGLEYPGGTGVKKAGS